MERIMCKLSILLSTHVADIRLAEMHGEDTVLVDIAEDILGCGVRV